MAAALASRAASASLAAPRAARRAAQQRCARVVPTPRLAPRRGSLAPHAMAATPGEGSGVEEKWSPVANTDPLFLASPEELIAADEAAAAAGGRAIMVTLDGGDASFRALEWALRNVARKKDVIHLVNVVPLDTTVSPYSFQPLNIVADPNLPQLDPGLRAAAEERGKRVLSDGVAAVHAAGRAAVAHLVIERTWESVTHVVCAKANELDVAALVVANSGKNWVKEMLAGSLTNYCVHHARVPVISVPPKERAEEPTHIAPA